MPQKKANDPSSTSDAYDSMLPIWTKIEAVLGGTETMRSMERELLPQHPEESDAAYNERLDRAVLLNMTEMTLTSLVSRPFTSPIKHTEDVPPKILELTDDIDLQGNSLDRFARNWFREGIAKGFSAVLVEFPRVEKVVNGRPRTLADDRKENLRPYFVKISPENIIFARAKVVNGQEVLTHVRILETEVVANGYVDEVVERIRVLEIGKGYLFQKVEDKNRKVTWKLVDEYEIPLPYIPLVVFYSDRQGLMLSKPPLLDLVNLNILHWQSTSDQIAILTVARFPMLAVSGAAETDDIVVGPNNLLSVTDPAGRYYYVEHSGRAIAAGRDHLHDLEEVMAEYGATFLKKRPGGATATARALDSAEVTSALQDMAFGFQDSLNLALFMMADWLKIKYTGSFSVKTDFGFSDKAQAGLEALYNARTLGDLNRTDYLLGLVRYQVLPDTFDPKANEKALRSETPSEPVGQANDKASAGASPANPGG